MKSLKAQHSILAHAHEQIEIIEHGIAGDFALVPFQEKLERSALYPLLPAQIEILQVNIGKMCNQTTALAALNRNDIFISESTFFYDEGGCC